MPLSQNSHTFDRRRGFATALNTATRGEPMARGNDVGRPRSLAEHQRRISTMLGRARLNPTTMSVALSMLDHLNTEAYERDGILITWQGKAGTAKTAAVS